MGIMSDLLPGLPERKPTTSKRRCKKHGLLLPIAGGRYGTECPKCRLERLEFERLERRERAREERQR